MLTIDGNHIYINRGDTGAVRIRSTGYTFAAADRCVFTLRAPDGSVVKEEAFPLTDGAFEVAFLNADTRNLAPGDGYYWGITYYMNPYYKPGETIPYNGNIVYTPTKSHMPFTIWTTAKGG